MMSRRAPSEDLWPRRDLATAPGNGVAAVHQAVIEALEYPPEKRAHRFLYFEPEDFLYPPAEGRTNDYTIIEISLFEGRSVSAKKKLLRLLFENLHGGAGLIP